MGYTGRPGPLVSEWSIVEEVPLFACVGMNGSGKEPGWQLFCFFCGGCFEVTVGYVLQHGHPLFSLTGTAWEPWPKRRIWRPRTSGDNSHI